MTNTNTAALYFPSNRPFVACPACPTAKRDCHLCSNSRRVCEGMAAKFAEGGIKFAWAWFTARLDEKIGNVVPRASGGFDVSGYVLRDESKPDTYSNRRWYTATLSASLSPEHAARAHFGAGAGVLRYEPTHFGTPSWAVLRVTR